MNIVDAFDERVFGVGETAESLVAEVREQEAIARQAEIHADPARAAVAKQNAYVARTTLAQRGQAELLDAPAPAAPQNLLLLAAAAAGAWFLLRD